MSPTRAGGTSRRIPARPRPVIAATNLGSVGVLKAGALVLLADERGDIVPDRRGLGLYMGDTRVLSTLALLIAGDPPTLLREDPAGAAAGTVQLTNPDLAAYPSPGIDVAIALPRQSIGLRRIRRIDPPALTERLVITNYTERPQRLVIRLLLDADGADIFEVRGRRRPRRGTILPATADDGTATFRYRATDGLVLTTTVEFDTAPDAVSPAAATEAASTAADWSIAVPPAAKAELGWRVTAGWSNGHATNGRRAASTGVGPAPGEAPEPAAAATLETNDEIVNLIIDRAIADLRLLRTPGPRPGEHFLAAGIPWFATLFGRDSLIAAYAALPFLPELAEDALTVLGRLQADRDDPAVDAEPGKILHELRTGEMARVGETPFAQYYGTVDATPLWLLLLAETVAWTGDDALVDRLWPHAIRALDWLEHSPRDADGFLAYRTRAPGGLRNQGWKDSSDAVRDRDGRILEPPIALAEVQAYAIEARRRMAPLARARGEYALAKGLDRDATDLAEQFDTRFWRADEERYAMAIAATGIADAMASNMGHCLWAGAVPEHRAPSVARSLLSPSLFSGWGIRTYGAGQTGFNPLGYHTGSVWPHDSAIAAAGLKRYGLHEEATRVAWAVLDAARRAPGFRLPEHFCGFDREAVAAPVVHPVSCRPQAWAAAATLSLVTTMLGLVPNAPGGELEIVRPVLPADLAMIRIRDLPIGTARVDLLFHRWRGTTSAEVLGRTGDVRVTVRL